MKNSDRQAFPLPSTDAEICPGLNKREYFAGLALQGLLASRSIAEQDTDDKATVLYVRTSIALADELLKQLEKYRSVKDLPDDEELTQQEIKDLKDGVPNYPMPEFQGPGPSLEHLCCECTGSGIMLGFYPCKPCGGKGYIIPEPEPEIIGEVREMTMTEIKELANPIDIEPEQSIDDVLAKLNSILNSAKDKRKKAMNEIIMHGQTGWTTDDLRRLVPPDAWVFKDDYPNERELSLLNARIAKLKVQLSKELQKKKSERNQFEINQIQQSINTLTKWKLPNKNLTRTGY